MEKIGERIKRLRNEKGLSQENIYPDNQSLVSQIESGKTPNPQKSTLKVIAGHMSLTIDDLVEDTDWKDGKHRPTKSEYAISPRSATVKLEKSGKITFSLKSYPRFDESGKENKFCPDTGEKLLTECKQCGTGIGGSQHIHCLKCGMRLFNVETNKNWWSIQNPDFWFDLKSNSDEIDRAQLHLNKLNYDHEMIYALGPSFSTQEDIVSSDFPPSRAEFEHGRENADDQKVIDYWIRYNSLKMLLPKIIDELWNYRDQIISKMGLEDYQKIEQSQKYLAIEKPASSPDLQPDWFLNTVKAEIDADMVDKARIKAISNYFAQITSEHDSREED